MKKLFDSILSTDIQLPTDKEEHQYLFLLLNIVTTKLLSTRIPPHRVSRLSPCRCPLCRYKKITNLLTKSNFPEQLTLPRNTPNYALKYLPNCIKSLNISHTLLSSLYLPNNLIYLNMSSTSAFATCFPEIVKLQFLLHLCINECHVTDSLLLELKDTHLISLQVTNNLLSDNGLKSLQNTTLGNTLQYFDVSNNKITRNILPTVLQFPNLCSILFKGCRVDQKSIKTFVGKHPHLQYNGMQIKTNKKFQFPTYKEIDVEWGIGDFTTTLCLAGRSEFSQMQTDKKTSFESIVFNTNK
ncbi:Leucine-rich repeat containing protein [Entamoeba marina]